jgi:hypothetical protein
MSGKRACCAKFLTRSAASRYDSGVGCSASLIAFVLVGMPLVRSVLMFHIHRFGSEQGQCRARLSDTHLALLLWSRLKH